MTVRPAAPAELELRKHVAAMRECRLPDWLRAAADPDLLVRALGARLHEVVPGALAVHRVRLEDARASRRRWTLRYAAVVEVGAGCREVALTAERYPPGTDPPTGAGAVLPGVGLLVRTTVADPDLPALADLGDPARAQQLLERALRGSARQGLPLVAAEPRLVRHKPGNRATLIYRLSYRSGADNCWPRTVVAKVYRTDEGAGTFAAMHALWRQRARLAREPTIAEPLAYLRTERVLLQGAIGADQTLADLITRTGATSARRRAVLRRTAEALATLHECDVRAGPTRDVGTQLAATRRLLARVAPSLAAEPVRATQALLKGLAGWDARHPASAAGPVHGAFRPAQVLLDGESPGFVDFDGFGVGEPALDVGRFLVRLGELDSDDTLATEFVAGYRTRAPLQDDRVRLWRCVDLASGVVRSWSRAQSARAAVLLDRLDRALARTD